MQDFSPSGLRSVPHLQWGSHLAHFFGAGDELRDVLVPYFKAGLENNERCLWVTGRAFTADEARAALRAAVPDLEARERKQQIEIANGEDWYAAGATLRPDDLVTDLLRREQDALGRGHAGLRTSGNCAFVAPAQWSDFQDYEQRVQDAVRSRRMICMCSYCTDQLDGGLQLDVMARHDLTLPSARPARPRDTAPDPLAREREKRTFDLAMTASSMGTWRYTLADNICIYDENAQRLYGLTEARFLHDEEGVKTKFHPDDMQLMWSRVEKALDPAGDGRYDVEYRVRQLDGSWRWLSAWGLVEFEGEGGDRKPVAISGASRDLTEIKQAEQMQRLLLNELNHRIKNTFATIQAITAHTFRNARDLSSARKALDQRIRTMAQAHDLLTMRSWSGASLTDVVARALDTFAPAQVRLSGTALELSPKQALSLSLALHELATNATKYGALSTPDGRVSVQWKVRGGILHLNWEESGGPPVRPPTQTGFGTRLLEEMVGRDLGGAATLRYDADGVRCSITARL